MRRAIALLLVATFLVPASIANACPFCNAVSQTLRQEMEVMDAVVIAQSIQSDATRNKESGDVLMKIEKVLKGGEHVRVGQEIVATYYGDVSIGRRFMLTGVDPDDMQWSCLPVSQHAEDYICKVAELGDDPVERLKFYYKHLHDSESILARDTYDEFAIAPYDAIKKLAPEIDRGQLIEWLSDPELTTDRKRLYLTMLGVCGDESDLPFLEKMLRSTQKSTRGGLDALIACYLTLSGESGLSLVDELFLANKKAPYADTYAAIMAIRFHGTEGGVIPRTALVESLHHVLERPDLADLVIPDLARWSDWSQIDRLKRLFLEADEDNNWVRVPVVQYLRACPKPEAEAVLKELEEVDPESIKRANSFFTIPIPARETEPSTSSVEDESKEGLAAIATDTRPGDGGSTLPAGPTASLAEVPQVADLVSGSPANPWRLGYVLALAMASAMILQFLLLSGGPQPASE